MSQWNPKKEVHRRVHTELKLISVIFAHIQHDSEVYTEEVTYKCKGKGKGKVFPLQAWL